MKANGLFPQTLKPALPFALFLQALEKANGRAEKIESFSQLVFQKPLVTEMQALGLIGEQNERRRRSSGLRDVVNFHLARRGRSSAVQVDLGEPAVQFTG